MTSGITSQTLIAMQVGYPDCHFLSQVEHCQHFLHHGGRKSTRFSCVGKKVEQE